MGVVGKWQFKDSPEVCMTNLSMAFQNKINRKAAREGGKIIKGAVKKEAPKLTGTTKQAIGLRVKMNRKKTAINAIVGVKRRFLRGKKTRHLQNGYPSKYTHLIVGGTKPHTLTKGDKRVARGKQKRRQTKKGPRHPGTKPNDFMSRALVWSMHAASEKILATQQTEFQKLNTTQSQTGVTVDGV